jgi:Ni/Co efflux regulator RcnB
MKRAALGALLISLVAGSTAMAGTVLPPAIHNGGHNDRGHEQHRPDNRSDDRGGRHDNARRNDRGSNWGNNGNNRRDDHRWDGRRDDHRWDNNRSDRRWDNDRRNDSRHYDGRWDNHRWVSPPHHVTPPRYSYSPPHHSHRWENGRWHWGSYYRPYGYAQRYWRRGDRLPVAYYGPRYVIGNYYDCGLRAPPYGYHWVRIDHDVVLAAIATGVVLDVIYNQFW